MINRPGLIVAAGADRPLNGAAAAAADIHGESALDGAELPVPTVPLSPLGAVEQMAALIEGHDRPVTIVATAPLTNVATLLLDRPDLHASIEQISIMGGSAERGNRSPLAEFNIWSDPEAAQVVFESGLPLRMVGLDTTHQALAGPAVIAELRGQGTRLGAICADLLLFFASAYDEVFGMPDPPLHDPLAMLAVVHPDWLTWRWCNTVIEVDGQYTRGATVVDLDRVTGRPPNAMVAGSLDTDRFWRLMIDSVAALG